MLRLRLKQRWLLPLGCLWLILGANLAWAQKAGITISRTELSPGQTFSITLSHPGDFGALPHFPSIAGMPAQGTSTSSSATIVNGQESIVNSVTVRYLARAEGKYVLKPFAITIGGQVYRHPGTTITVKKGVDDEPDPATTYDPFEDFFGSRRNTSYKEVKENAFLALHTDKDDVYVGEGFSLTLSLFVAEDNQAEMQFYDLTAQVIDITKQIKPSNCWEESFGITSIEPRPTRINGKGYTEYRIWQSTFYPLETKRIDFPKINLQMAVLQQAADPFFGGLNARHKLKTFSSHPFAVKVKELPASPFSGPVAVGDFHLVEGIGRSKVETGQSVSYQFSIKGEGNIAAINMPTPPATEALDVYPPNVQQNILRDLGKVTGTKIYTFLLQPKQAGKYPLAKQGFVFPFFNPKTGRYDSLKSSISLTATGTGNLVQTGNATEEGDYLSNNLLYLDNTEGLKAAGNVVLLVLTVGLAGVILWRRKEKKN